MAGDPFLLFTGEHKIDKGKKVEYKLKQQQWFDQSKTTKTETRLYHRPFTFFN